MLSIIRTIGFRASFVALQLHGRAFRLVPLPGIEIARGLAIGVDAAIERRLSIIPFGYCLAFRSNRIKALPRSADQVAFGDDVWIRACVKMFAGATIHPRPILSAGASASA